MKKTLLFAVLACLAMVFSGCCKEKRDLPKGINGGKIAASAKVWLEKMDKGLYEEWYDEASQYFKETVDKELWLNNLQKFRAPFGESSKRKEINSFFDNKPENSPEGEYVTIQYASVVHEKLVIIETVTFMKEEDGSWKIAGYYIK
ncbi:MAG: DUF4019 domain-containing protein [Endomicrobium sp.]|jgi:hypothetical protein|nr:DUF4019 domain-containing protein [Endomicrobium sp.]